MKMFFEKEEMAFPKKGSFVSEPSKSSLRFILGSLIFCKSEFRLFTVFFGGSLKFILGSLVKGQRFTPYISL